jgi:hypothetical protein
MEKEFMIEDWAGNRMFPEKTFSTFEDGWDFIYSNVEDEEMYQDVYVVECKLNYA